MAFFRFVARLFVTLINKSFYKNFRRRMYYETGEGILNENDVDFPINFAKEDTGSASKYKYFRITK